LKNYYCILLYTLISKIISPNRLVGVPRAEQDGIAVSIQNRFNHTDLSEVAVKWRLGAVGGQICGAVAKPGEIGVCVIPVPYKAGAELALEFIDAFGNTVDEALEILDAAPAKVPELCGIPKIEESAGETRISGCAQHGR
jgi:hypothetical protein